MKKVKFFSCILLLIFSYNVYAVSKDANIGSDMNEYQCSAFQDDKMYISGDAYFGRCLEATCNGRNWEMNYYDSSRNVTCTNGNLNPYTKIVKSGCDAYNNRSCECLDGRCPVKYCTTITYFDCTKTAPNGDSYQPTTTKITTKKPTTKVTTKITTKVTTTTTEPAKNNNTYLNSLTLSSGTITFDKNIKEYTTNVENNIKNIEVIAIAEVSTSKVNVSGNINLVTGKNKITITVTAEDGSVGTYIINVNKDEVLSSNALLSTLTINGDIINNFNSSVFNYTYKTKDSSIKVEAETIEENAIYMVSGTENIKDGSVVKVTVTAPDGITMQEYNITINMSNSSSIVILIFVILIVILVGGGIYYFYTKQKNGGEKEYEYE